MTVAQGMEELWIPGVGVGWSGTEWKECGQKGNEKDHMAGGGLLKGMGSGETKNCRYMELDRLWFGLYFARHGAVPSTEVVTGYSEVVAGCSMEGSFVTGDSEIDAWEQLIWRETGVFEGVCYGNDHFCYFEWIKYVNFCNKHRFIRQYSVNLLHGWNNKV